MSETSGRGRGAGAAHGIGRLRSAARRIRRGGPPGPGIIVLGMHRSGTSAATRIVSMLGLTTCIRQDMVRGPWNPSGHWESRTMMHFDDRLLAEMGCSWWSPPAPGEAYFRSADRITTSARKARAVFGAVHPSAPWVWKDPRACLLVPFWRQALGEAAAVVVYRNPLEVSASIEARHDLPRQFGLALWERYNRLLLEHLAGLPVLVTRYEDLVGDPLGWASQARAFLAGLAMAGHEVPMEELNAFVDPRLRHSRSDPEELAAHAPGTLPTYQALEAALGSSRSFVPPQVREEAPWVGQELASLGPSQRPGWRPPTRTSAT
jgi:hypothetical protein